MSSPHVVVVDDDKGVRDLLEKLMVGEGYQVTCVPEGAAAVRAVQETPVQVVLVDLKLPGMDGFEVLDRISQIDPKIATIVMTGWGTIDDAVRAMKSGAFDFITKPFSTDAVLLVLKKAIEYQRLRQENQILRTVVRDQSHPEQLVCKSPQMQSVFRFVQQVADSDSTVLIQGESGTGKELIARMLHFNSLRHDRALVVVNCGGIPENLLESELFGHERGAFTGAVHRRIGRFEMAHGGTIFLDEVGEMPVSLQVKFLRVLQERCFERVGGEKTISVDVRVIAATNQNLEDAIKANRFRPDLYYRLNVIPVTIPALRDHASDIPLLIDHFIQKFNRNKHAAVEGVAPDAMNQLMRYHWPGNIRELENVIERMVVVKKTGRLEASDLPDSIAEFEEAAVRWPAAAIAIDDSGIELDKEVEKYENHLISLALRQANGVTARAAQLLHMNRTTLIERLKRKGLDAHLEEINSVQ